jgi:hypothetical protein
MMEKREESTKRLKNEFSSFSKRMIDGKHSHWFECLNSIKRFNLFMMQKSKKKEITKSGKSFSLNKFMFKAREMREFKIPKNILREKALDKILK